MSYHTRISDITSAQTAARDRQALREKLEHDVEAFKARGGQIEDVPRGYSAWMDSGTKRRRIMQALKGANAPRTRRGRQKLDA